MARSGRLGGVLAAASAGWWFGFGYFLAGLYWLGHAFLVDAKTFGWLLPFAVTALPAAMAIYTALGLALARAIWTRGATRVLALAVALTLAEWLRGHLFSGFPWNTYGYALISPLWLAQGAALIGIWGLTFLAVAIYASPAVLADARTDTRRPWLAPALSVVVIAALAIYGAVRLAGTSTSYVDGVHLRIMQPNLQQDDKFNYARKQQVMSRYLALSERAHGTQSNGLQGVTHLIWPESAFPFFLTREPDVLAQIAALLREGTVLITGAIRAPDTTPPGGVVNRAYNSIYVIGHDGSILSVYDKVHLVPFGEYLAVSGSAGAARPRAAHQGARRLHPGRPPPRSIRTGSSKFSAAGLLRDHFSERCGARPRTARLALSAHRPLFRLAVRRWQRRATRLAPEPHQ